MQKNEIAKNYFNEGCNCCQAVVLAFASEMGMNKDALARISSSFGAGMGGLKEVCGAVSGMFMVLGAVCGYGEAVNAQEKSEHAARIREAAEKFQNEFGSLLCRELKSGNRDRTYCANLVQYAASLAETYTSKE